MKAITFTLEGPFAFFKRADMRSGRYFTYNHIHRIGLLGMIGAVIGLEGYNTHHLRKQLGENTPFFPEFYEKLQDLKVAIVPNGSAAKQMHGFTDTTVFSNKDGTLMVHEQWLLRPSWDIYLLMDGSVDAELEEKAADYLLGHRAVYLPYLGKNDHPATFSRPKKITLETEEGEGIIDSLIPYNSSFQEALDEQEDGISHLLLESMPIRLDRGTGNYVYERMLYTNASIETKVLLDKESGRRLCFI